MKASDLRIGNWVKYTGRPDYEYWPIADYHFRQIIEGHCRVVGVPLTEEWLLKFGFPIEAPYTDNDGFCDVGVMSFNLDDGFLYADEIHDWCNVLNWNPIKYVHQLQNLYHALTGQELKIK